MKRRHFLLAASGGLAAMRSPAWADLGAPLFLTAANHADGSAWLVGLSPIGVVRFSLPLPTRGHTAAAHPERSEAVVFARRPGRYALVIDPVLGREVARLASPEGRHFYGHGAFSADGRHLFTTENAYDIPDGRIGVWDAQNGYARLGEFPSGGLGPHEILRISDGSLAIANGGIQTHPDFGRAKLNLPDMRPNLSIIGESGTLRARYELDPRQRQNSIRHLAKGPDGTLFAALQWQGPPGADMPLVARFAKGRAPAPLSHPDTALLRHFAGSIAISADGDTLAVTGPKGGHVLLFKRDGTPAGGLARDTASGVAPLLTERATLAITRRGGMTLIAPGETRDIAMPGAWHWDNHLIAVA